MSSSSQLVIVLGMHRSGTSALARGLPILGISLGEDFITPRKSNKKGFWEDAGINEINVEIHRSLARDWDSLGPISPNDLTGMVSSNLGERAMEAVRRRIADHGSFAMKDPRLTLLLPFWRAVFERLGVKPTYLIACRNPISVVRSLEQRDNISATKGYVLWLEHMATALDQTKGLPRLVVDYDRLMDDPTSELGRIARRLDVPFAPNGPETVWYRGHFLEGRLRHSRYCEADLAEQYAAPPGVRELYRLLLTLAADRKPSREDERCLPQSIAWLTQNRAALDSLHAADLNTRVLAKQFIGPGETGHLDGNRLVDYEGDLRRLKGEASDPERQIISTSQGKGGETAINDTRPIKVLVFAPAWMASVIINVLNPLVALEKKGEVQLKLRFTTDSALAESAMEWCDVAVFCRTCQIADLSWLYQIKRLGKTVIYDIDDNFEEIPLTTPLGFFHRSFYRLHVVRRFYALADLTRVYSPQMRQSAEKHGAHVSLERSYFDSAIIAHLPPPPKSSIVKIAYPSSRTDEPRLERMLYEALRRVLLRHPGKVELHLWRKCPAALLGLKGVMLHPVVSRYKKFVSGFYQEGFDIGLAPLLDEPFFRSKTNNKYRELGGCGVAGIYSDMAPYTDCVVDGKTGIMTANTVDAWAEAINRLIENADLRAEIGRNAQGDVFANYTLNEAVNSFRNSLKEAITATFKPCDWLYSDDLILSVGVVESANPTPIELEGEQLNRVLFFHQAVRSLGGEPFATIDAKSVRSRPDIAKPSNVMLFIVNSLEDLANAALAASLCNSVILDITRLDADAHAFRTACEALGSLTPTTLVVSARQKALLAVAESLSLPCSVISLETKLLDVEFSSGGYCAAYLDGIERHMRFGARRRESRWDKSVGHRRDRLSHVLNGYSGRLRQAWYFGCWLVGMRPL